MSQRTVIEVTTTDTVEPTEENGLNPEETHYAVGRFDGAGWKVSVAEGFVILSARDGLGKIIVPAWRVREVEVTPLPSEIRVVHPDDPIALVDPQGNEFIAPPE